MLPVTFEAADRYRFDLTCGGVEHTVTVDKSGIVDHLPAGSADPLDQLVWASFTCEGLCKAVERWHFAPALLVDEHAPTRTADGLDWAWSLLGADQAELRLDYLDAGVRDLLDIVEWSRAGVHRPDQVRAWLAAGAIDGHDAACWSRSGHTHQTMDAQPGRNGCQALQKTWPATRPATRTCARRTATTTPAQADTISSRGDGVVVELYRSTRHEQPVVALITRDPSGAELHRTVVDLEHSNQNGALT